MNLGSDLSRAWPSAGVARRAWYVLTDPGSQAVALMRLQVWVETRGLAPVGRLVRYINHTLNGLDWVSGAHADAGLVFRHPSGVVVGARTRLGRDVTIMQGVTLGQSGLTAESDGANPVVGNGVLIGAGAILIGEITIGDNVVVGAGAVVTRDVPAGMKVVGNPARIVNGGADAAVGEGHRAAERENST